MDKVVLNIFFAYARADSQLRNRLDKHLSLLKRRNYINTWFDGEIKPGRNWETEIDEALNTADIVLLLISADFIASDYCYEVEMKKAIERHERGNAVIIPIILQPCDWQDSPFAKIQALPQNGKPITDSSWTSIEYALNESVSAIKHIIDDLRVKNDSNLRGVNQQLIEKERELNDCFAEVEEQALEKEIIQEEVERLRFEQNKLETENQSLSTSRVQLTLEMELKSKQIQTTLSKFQTQINRKKENTIDLTTKIELLQMEKKNLERDIRDLKVEYKKWRSNFYRY